MIEIFRTNQVFATFLLIPYTFLIRIHSLIYPVKYEVEEFDTPIAKYIFSDLLNSGIWQSIIACVIIFLIGNFINRAVIQNRLSKHLTLLPGLFFILITAGMPSGLILSPAMLSCFFIMLLLLNLYRTYKNKDSAVHIFNTGFYIGMATLLYPANSFLIFFGLIGLLNLRSLKFQDLINYFSGIFVPAFLLFTYYYWYDQSSLIYEYFQIDKGIFALFSPFQPSTLVYFVSIGLIVIYAISRYNVFTLKNSIQVQRKIDIIYWLMLSSFFMLFFVNGITFTHLVILSIPFAIFVGLSYEKVKSRLMAELMHVGLLILILVFQFQNFI